jgi:molecular chaperone GrpE (heat shock protein)
MNTSEQLREGPVQSPANQQQEVKEQVVHQKAQETNPVRTEQTRWRGEVVTSGLEKALDALFKAQDHLNTAADQGGDGLSKMIEGFNRSLRGLQRELAQVIYRLGNGG